MAGVTTAVHLTSDAPCRTCNGSGAKPGTVPHRCSNCGGQGVVSDNQGLFSLSSPCPVCAGRGEHHRRPLPDVPRHRSRAPPSRGQGAGPGRGRRRAAHPPEGPGWARSERRAPGRPLRRRAGRAAPVVQRRGRDLTLTVPITFPEAALGADITVPTLDGGSVRCASRRAPARDGPSASRARASPPPRAPGICWSSWRSRCRPTCRAPSARRWRRYQAASNGASPREHLGV